MYMLRLVGCSVRRERWWGNPEVNNKIRRSALMTKGVQRNKEDYHKGIVGGAVQAQSMTMVIEGASSLYTQE
jgi:hypothetical protein